MLLGCLGARPRGARPPAAPAADWTAVLRVAERHALTPLLHRALRDGGAAPATPAPAAVLAAAERAYHCSALRNEWVLAGLARVLDVLRARGVPAIVLKGAYLAGAVYGDAALRPMSDVDLLLPADRLTEAAGALGTLGYTGYVPWDPSFDYDAHHHARPLVCEGAVPVELHRGPSRHPGFRASGSVWARAAETEVAGAPALALSPEDLLVHLCVHVAHDHAFDVKLLHLYDLAAVAERFGARLDWERVAAAAGEAGVASYVYCALRVADSLFGLDGSARAGVEAVPHGPADDAATSLVRAYVVAEPPDVGEAYRRVHGEHTLLGAARALARAIVPPAHDLRLARGLPLDRPVGAREYLDHAWTRLRRRGGDVVEMVLGSPRMRAAREHARARRAIGRWVVSRAAPAVPAPLASPASPPPVRRARTR